MKLILRAAALLATMTATAAMAQTPLEIVGAIPCTKAGYGDLSNMLSGSAPLGIAQRLWTREIANALLRRVADCRGKIEEVQTRVALQRLPIQLNAIVAEAELDKQRAEQAELREAKLRQAQEEHRQIEAERQAAEAERKRREEERHLAEAEERSRKDAERLAAETERKRREEERTAMIRERLSALPPDARKFIAENPGMEEPSFGTEAGPRTLISLYTSELAFRVCRERFGGWGEAVTEAKRRSTMVQTILIDGFGMPADNIPRLRANLGLDSGQSEIIVRMRVDRDMLATCRQFQSAMGTSPPLR